MSIRHFPGINVSRFPRELRSEMQVIDTTLRAMAGSMSENLTPTDSMSAGTAPANASFLTVSNEPVLSNERRLVVSSPLSGTDGGAGGAYTLSLSATALGGTPALVFGTTNVEGTAATFIPTDSTLAIFDTTVPAALAGTAATGSAAFAARRDHVHLFPTSLRSTANGSTLTLTDSGSEQTLASSLGSLVIESPSAVVINARAGTASTGFSVNLDPDSGNRTGIAPSWFGGNVSSATLACWDAQFSSLAGVFTTATFVGYRCSTFSFLPSATSDTANKAYTMDITGPVINNATGGWTEVAGINITGPRRSLSNPTVTGAGTIIIECPTISATQQAGIYIKQRTAQQTATDRYGILIDAQNSGTNRYSIKAITDSAWLGGTLFDDNAKEKYGTGRDAEIYYDGTNLIADPDVVGTGRLLVGATGDDDMLLNAIEIDGDLNHDGANVGFYGVAPAARSAAYTPTNVTTDRAYDANATAVDELADVLGTLIGDLQATGIIG